MSPFMASLNTRFLCFGLAYHPYPHPYLLTTFINSHLSPFFTFVQLILHVAFTPFTGPI